MTAPSPRDRRVRLPRPRPSWPLVLLVVTVLVTAFGAFQAQRTVRSHHRTAERLLRDYASFAAWSSQQQVVEVLEGAIMASLQYVMHGRELHQRERNGPVPSADDLWNYFNSQERYRTRFCTRTRCPESFPPSAYFGFTLGADTMQVSPRGAAPEGDPWLEVSPPADRKWLVDTLTTHIRRVHDADQNYEVVVSPRFGAGRLLAYTVMPTDWGDTAVYGVEFGARTTKHIFRDGFSNEPLLPRALMGDRSNADLLGVRVSGPGSLPLYESPSWPASEFAGDAAFGAQFGGLVVQAVIRPEYANQLVIGGLPASRLPILIGLLLLSGALSVVALVQLKREQELARLRADFVSSVSHELRTPLAQIRLFLETLRLGRFRTEEQRRWSLDNIERETNRLAHLVENILHFSRTARRAPTTPARSEPTDVGAEIEQIARAFEPLAASRRASLALDLATGVTVPLQREAFRQVLLNLLDNAVKYGPAGQTVMVTLTLERSGGAARVAVTDEGPGVPAGEREAIWTPFFRGSAAASQGAGGSGIGLAIVKDLVATMGGRVGIADGARGGASVWVELPDASHGAAAARAGEPEAAAILDEGVPQGSHPELPVAALPLPSVRQR